jgi:hypothetical protein
MRKLRGDRQGLCAGAARRKGPVARQNRGAVLLSGAHVAYGRVKFTSRAPLRLSASHGFEALPP